MLIAVLEELWRLFAVLDVIAFWMLAYWIIHQYGPQSLQESPPLKALVRAGAAMLTIIMVAVVANFLGPVPPTDGVKLFAILMFFIVLYLLHAVGRYSRVESSSQER